MLFRRLRILSLGNNRIPVTPLEEVWSYDAEWTEIKEYFDKEKGRWCIYVFIRRTEPSGPIDIEIRDFVNWLNRVGFETYESCAGHYAMNIYFEKDNSYRITEVVYGGIEGYINCHLTDVAVNFGEYLKKKYPENIESESEEYYVVTFDFGVGYASYDVSTDNCGFVWSTKDDVNVDIITCDIFRYKVQEFFYNEISKFLSSK